MVITRRPFNYSACNLRPPQGEDRQGRLVKRAASRQSGSSVCCPKDIMRASRLAPAANPRGKLHVGITLGKIARVRTLSPIILSQGGHMLRCGPSFHRRWYHRFARRLFYAMKMRTGRLQVRVEVFDDSRGAVSNPSLFRARLKVFRSLNELRSRGSASPGLFGIPSFKGPVSPDLTSIHQTGTHRRRRSELTV